MKIYKRYILADLLKINLLLLLIFSSFYFLIDFFEKLGDFLSYKKSFFLFLTYVFWKSWVNLYEFFPFVCGLSGIILLLWLARTGELIAFLSLGFTKKELISIIGTGIFSFALLGGGVINVIFPRAAYLSLYTWDHKIAEEKEQYLVFNEQIFLKGENFYLIAKPLEPKGEYLQDILIVFLTGEEPREIIWAKRAYYKAKHWFFKDVIFQKKEKNFSPVFLKNFKADISLKPDTLVVVEKPLKFLSFKELFERYEFLKMVGRPYKEVLSEMFLKIIYVFIPFFLGFFPLVVFLNNYTPSQIMTPFLKSLILFFTLLIVYFFLQTILRKGMLWAGILLSFFVLSSFLNFILLLKKK